MTGMFQNGRPSALVRKQTPGLFDKALDRQSQALGHRPHRPKVGVINQAGGVATSDDLFSRVISRRQKGVRKVDQVSELKGGDLRDVPPLRF
ncbi:hypothetical protein SH203_00679 [Brevundimonas sp. SH203]|nr:hypothetical protein SH203_00679 [Brevundimonas sp. SH203]